MTVEMLLSPFVPVFLHNFTTLPKLKLTDHPTVFAVKKRSLHNGFPCIVNLFNADFQTHTEPKRVS